jgi:hypothetical protein
LEALAIRVKQSIFRTTCQIHYQGLVYKEVISPAMPRLGPQRVKTAGFVGHQRVR